MEAWSDGLARLPAQFHADRAELLGLLRKNAILHESPTQPILSRDGSTARWMLDSLQVTLTPRGAELAGRCVLELLKRFEGRQIATLGLTAAPILNSAIMQSGGRYHGLLIRAQRKQHGSLKLIEGPIDPNEPTILLDVPGGTKLMNEETFGPVAPLTRFSTEQEVIAMSNDTEFGLAAYFYTRDIGRVWRVAEALEYGIVGINEGLISTEVAPFGGMKQSGIGREGSRYGIEEYVEVKYLCMGGV